MGAIIASSYAIPQQQQQKHFDIQYAHVSCFIVKLKDRMCIGCLGTGVIGWGVGGGVEILNVK